MNILVLLVIGLVVYVLGYRFYGRFISKVFGEDDRNPTPAVQFNDDKDYVPSPLGVAFSHHFASIAGAGPIVGPTVAVLFGVIPVWLWLLLGAVFFGAVHDFTALFSSMREKGKSMAEVARINLGRPGFMLFIGFTSLMILLITSAFLGLTAASLTSLVPVQNLKIDESATVLKTVTGADGIVRAQIGGIASTSVIVLSSLAPIVGWLLYRKKVGAWKVAFLAMLIGGLSIYAGVAYPVSLDPKTWMIILAIYVVIAAGVPVWLVLQPRDFMNSFILYAGIAMLAIGVVAGGLTGVAIQAPAFNLAQGDLKLGYVWPFLFITVACGAISGFHSLVAGGTVSKQASRESHARVIGYGGMILEGVLALLVLLTVASGLSFDTYLNIVWPAKGAANPILAFSLSMGGLLHNAIGVPISFGTVFGILMVEGFVITTLDTAVRLNRYLFEELWAVLFKNPPAFIRSYLFNAVLASALMLWLAYTNTFQLIWPIFGATNQLMAALTLIAVSVWLAYRGKPTFFTLIPAVFMMLTTMTGLVMLFVNVYLPKRNVPLMVADLVLLALALGVAWVAGKKLLQRSKGTAVAPTVEEPPLAKAG
jgi:carbon starvation protein